jgi:SsrA-binding protein
MNNKTSPNTIALNKKARYEYFIEETYECGVILLGWEVKSLRSAKVQLVDSYITLKNSEAYWLGGHIIPLPSASTHIVPDAQRTRKLLLSRKELNKLIGKIEQKGYTLVPVKLYWKNGRAKLEIGLAKGKKQHDKRAAEKAKEWRKEKQSLLRP